MKNLIGKKVRGFKFDSRDHCVWFVTLEDYIGRVGVVDEYLDMVNVFIVKYGEDCLLYPAELIEQHIVEEEDTLTPQGKARELAMRFDRHGETDNAKQCALIAVDEILNNFGTLTEGKQHYAACYTINFYEQVKTEIEKL